MRSALENLHRAHHTSKWWVGHGVGAVVGAVLVLYAAGVLLVGLLALVL